MKLWQQILLGMVLGVVAGWLLGSERAEYIKPLGVMFINLIKMIIVPLIFFSLVSAVTSMDDIKRAGRIGLKSFGLYLFTTAFAITLGLVVASFFELGGGVDLNLGSDVDRTVQEPFALSQMLINVVPVNPIQSMADGNVLQIIVFAILLGAAINMAGDKGKRVASMCDCLAEVIYKLTHIIMKMAPIGVFALMAWLVGTQDAAVVKSLAKVVVAVYAICIIHAVCVYGGMLALLARVSPWPFFKKLVPAQMVAYTTSSSSATLPVTMQVAENSLGVSKETSSFTLPLGTTVNMDGTALYQGVCALFVAQALGVELVFADYITIILTATLASIGSAGVPGAGLIMLSLVLQSIGLPIEGVAVIAGIDRLLDMARTTVNVTGDATIAVIVDKTEGHFDRERYVANEVVQTS